MGLQISRGVHPEVPETNPVRATEKRLGRGVPAIGIAKREPDRRGAFDVRSRAYDDLDTTEVFGIASGRVHHKGRVRSILHEYTESESGILLGRVFGLADTLCQRWAATKR